MSEKPPLSADALAASLAAIGEREPLVQHLTNTVTINDVANITLHWGALPVMADTPNDAPEMARAAGSMLLNTGQLGEPLIEALHNAGRAANDRGIPVVLDPVGVGSTPTRNETIESLLSEIEFAAIKGNYGEISALAGVEAEVKGVESVGDYDAIEETARALAESTETVVVASGVDDIVATGETAYRVESGHQMMGEVVGTGCMLGSTVAAFCGGLDDPLAAALYGTLAFGLAGERAAEIEYNGPASYRTNFLDSVWTIAAGDHELDTDPSERIESVE